MAAKKPLEVVQPLPTEETAPSIEAISDRLNDEIASQILDNIDWQKVTKAIIRQAPAKLFAWLTSGNNVSSREKEGEGSHLFVGEVNAVFYCHRNKPIHAFGYSFPITIRSDGSVSQGYESDLHSELISYFEKAGVTTEPTKNLGKGLR